MSLTKTAQITESRMERAVRIFDAGLVRKISAGTFVVKSESTNLHYIVNTHGCTCPDSLERQMICKHAWAAFIGAALTIWRLYLATSKSEVEAIAACDHSNAPEGIKRTIRLECQKAIERLSAKSDSGPRILTARRRNRFGLGEMRGPSLLFLR